MSEYSGFDAVRIDRPIGPRLPVALIPPSQPFLCPTCASAGMCLRLDDGRCGLFGRKFFRVRVRVRLKGQRSVLIAYPEAA